MLDVAKRILSHLFICLAIVIGGVLVGTTIGTVFEPNPLGAEEATECEHQHCSGVCIPPYGCSKSCTETALLRGCDDNHGGSGSCGTYNCN